MSQEVPWWEAATLSAVVTSVAVCVRAGPFANQWKDAGGFRTLWTWSGLPVDFWDAKGAQFGCRDCCTR